MDASVYRAIRQLPRWTVAALRTKYRDLFGEEAKSTHKQLLVRRIAWQLQAKAEGDLSERARQRASEIVDDTDLGTGSSQRWLAPAAAATPLDRPGSERDGRLPHPGSLLRRTYQGRDIVVKVLEQGFEYEAKHYRSLSAIAREVTGTRWNGVLFFGLTERRNG